MTINKYMGAVISCVGLTLAGSWAIAGNNITHDLASAEVNHKGKSIKIVRTDAKDTLIPAAYAKIGRPCPPYCIQPMKIAEGVETVGELEVINYLSSSQPGNENFIGTPRYWWLTLEPQSGLDGERFQARLTSPGQKSASMSGGDFLSVKILVFSPRFLLINSELTRQVRSGISAKPRPWYFSAMETGADSLLPISTPC